jgi:hypothetical protein
VNQSQFADHLRLDAARVSKAEREKLSAEIEPIETLQKKASKERSPGWQLHASRHDGVRSRSNLIFSLFPIPGLSTALKDVRILFAEESFAQTVAAFHKLSNLINGDEAQKRLAA